MRIRPEDRLDPDAWREARARQHEAGTLPPRTPRVGIDEPGGAGSYHPAYVNTNARNPHSTTPRKATTKKRKVK